MKLIHTVATVAAAAAAVLTLAAPASGNPPEKAVWTAAFTFDDTTTCPGITIRWSYEERDTLIEFAPTRWHFQRHGVAVLTANGKTLTHNFSASVLLDPTTTVVQVVGAVFNIQAAGVGNVLVDAGNIVVDNATDPPTVLQIGGPHPAFFGDVAGLCDYLADP